MSREQKLKLIFVSGMSTSEGVTDISGRRVRRHAVQQAVENIGGHLTIFSEEGRGTLIVLRIPKARRRVLRKAG